MTVVAVAARASSSLGGSGPDGSDGAATLGLWCAALCLWGFGKGVVDGPVLALFADSVPTGDRATYYYYLFLAFWFGALAGPLVGVALFMSQANAWTFPELASVILVGCGFKLVNAALLCFLKDEAALGAAANHIGAPAAAATPDSSASSRGGDAPLAAIPATVAGNEGPDGPDAAIAEKSALVAAACEDEKDDVAFDARIPRLVFAASLVSQLGSGMTVGTPLNRARF
jgi:hypothetical protein